VLFLNCIQDDCVSTLIFWWDHRSTCWKALNLVCGFLWQHLWVFIRLQVYWNHRWLLSVPRESSVLHDCRIGLY